MYNGRDLIDMSKVDQNGELTLQSDSFSKGLSISLKLKSYFYNIPQVLMYSYLTINSFSCFVLL